MRPRPSGAAAAAPTPPGSLDEEHPHDQDPFPALPRQSIRVPTGRAGVHAHGLRFAARRSAQVDPTIVETAGANRSHGPQNRPQNAPRRPRRRRGEGFKRALSRSDGTPTPSRTAATGARKARRRAKPAGASRRPDSNRGPLHYERLQGPGSGAVAGMDTYKVPAQVAVVGKQRRAGRSHVVGPVYAPRTSLPMATALSPSPGKRDTVSELLWSLADGRNDASTRKRAVARSVHKRLGTVRAR